MKRLYLFIICFGIGITGARAYDFAQSNTDGVLIYYNIINDSTVIFASDEKHYADSSLIHIDTLHLPTQVTYNSVTYNVDYENAYGFNAPTRARPKVIWMPASCGKVPFALNLLMISEDSLHYNGRDSISLNSVLSYEIADENPWLKSEDGVIYSRNGDTLLLYPSGRRGTFNVPENVSILGSHCFSYTALDTLNIGDNVIDIGNYIVSLSLCLKSFRYPNAIRRIESVNAVFGLVLEEIILGSGTEFFYGLGGMTPYLSRIKCLAITPPEVGFDQIKGIDTLTLYVPRKSIELYRQAQGWNTFYAILPIEPPIVTGVDTASVSWVQNFSATGYVWTLYLDEAKTQRFMSLTFDANGHLTHIDINSGHMPERMPALYHEDGEEEKRFAEYYSFTISGLSPDTKYYYTRQSMNGTTVIDEETGSFKTLSSETEGLEETGNGKRRAEKFIKEGKVLIQKEKKKYTINGKLFEL